MPLKPLIIAFSSFFTFQSYAQPSHTQDFRELWITGFRTSVLGNIQAEDSLLTYASENDFNSLICTNIFQILTDGCLFFTTEMIALQSLINKAHVNYGIDYISGNVGSEATAQKIQDYNRCSNVSASERFDKITYECEFYNSATNGSCSDFNSFITQVSGIKNICLSTTASNDTERLLCEVYIGGPGTTGAVATNSSQSEMQQIASLADHILLTYYRTTPSSSGVNFFNWTINRLQWLANAENGGTQIVLLLKSRDTDGNNMYDYLTNFPGSHVDALKDPYYSWVEGPNYDLSLTEGYLEQFSNGTLPWLDGIKVVGYTWFEHMACMEIHDVLSVGIEENDVSNFNVYPNPSTGWITIKTTDLTGDLSFEVKDVLGRIVLKKEHVSKEESVFLSKGSYLITSSNNGLISRPVKVIID